MSNIKIGIRNIGLELAEIRIYQDPKQDQEPKPEPGVAQSQTRTGNQSKSQDILGVAIKTREPVKESQKHKEIRSKYLSLPGQECSELGLAYKG